MKIALITDTHWGVRNDNQVFLDNNKKFLDNVFFPYIGENNINSIIHLGDLVDRRKYINIQTAKRLREDFLEPIASRQIDLSIIAGNHDTYYKNTNNVNSLRELVMGRYEFTYIHDKEPVEKIFDGLPILFIPWICDENKEQSLRSINESNAQIAMGHLEVSGFQMYKGSMLSHGEDPSLYQNYDMVMSGHYHHKSSNRNIFYLGSHAEFTWSDYDDPKGFHIFDTEKRTLEFIKNPYTIFKMAYYDDSRKQNLDVERLKDHYVKVVVVSKKDYYGFDKFIDSIEEAGVIDLQVVTSISQEEILADDTAVDESEDTLTIFKKHIHNTESSEENRNRMEKMVSNLYHEALSVE